METPKEESLRKLSYTELKKCAKERGITKNLKADVLISLILEKAKNAEDSFVTLENEIMNSCKKNKEARFEEDKQVGSETPRRETYTLECPSDNIMAIDNDHIVTSASPVLRKTPTLIETSLNDTMSRGSERKTKKRKVSFVTPLRKSARLNAMTPRFASVKDRPKTPIPSRFSSERKSPSIKAKISFSETPSEKEKGNSVFKKSGGKKGERVSTPMPSSKCKKMNLSSSGLNVPVAAPEISFTETAKGNIPEEDINLVAPIATPEASISESPKGEISENMESDVKEPAQPVFRFTATPENRKATTSKSDEKVGTPSALSKAGRRLHTPKSSVKTASPLVVQPKSLRTISPRSNIKRAVTPRPQSKRIATPLSLTGKDKRTPRSCVKNAITPGVQSGSKVKIPNFKELHQKEFEKMESIGEYQQRKAVYSAKKLKEQNQYKNLAKSSASKRAVPKNKGMKKFGGIPFIPSITSTKDMKLDALTFKSHIAKLANKKPASASRIESASIKKAEAKIAKKAAPTPSRENTPLKRRFKFDLQASLTKKLPYKPHKGPLKPLVEKNTNTSILNPAPSKPIPENKLIEAKRVESRKAIRGVRVNRRFELQMQKRKLASD